MDAAKATVRTSLFIFALMFAFAFASAVPAHKALAVDEGSDASVAPIAAQAVAEAQAATVVESGTWGTCQWQLTSEGVLRIGSGTGEDTEFECPWMDYVDQVKRVVFTANVIAPEDCSCLFEDMEYVEAIDLKGLDTSQTTNMAYMFSDCYELTDLDLSKFSTASATDMEGMFLDCWKLESLDFSSFNTSKVKAMSDMFDGCHSLTSLDLSTFITSKVDEDEMEDMFYECRALTTITVGAKTALKVWPAGSWVSSKNGNTYEVEHILASRKGIADTYTKVPGTGEVDDPDSEDPDEDDPDADDPDADDPDADDPDSEYMISNDTVTIEFSEDEYVATGNVLKPEPIVTMNGRTLVQGEDYTVKYSNNFEPGIATVTIRGIGDYSGRATAEFTIVASNYSLEDEGVTVTVKKTEFTYDGTAKLPAVKIVRQWTTPRGVEKKTTLSQGSDYSIQYTNNVNAGKGKIIITGQGEYTGQVVATFTIAPASMSRATVSTVKDKIYNGKAFKPKPKVTYNGKKLKLNKDYKLMYKKNKKVGTATVIVKGIGNYSGNRMTYFSILKNKLIVKTKGNDVTISMKGTGWVTVPSSAYGTKKGTKNNTRTITYKPGKYIVPRLALDSYTTIKGTGATFKHSSVAGYYVAGELDNRPGGYGHFKNVKIIGGDYIANSSCSGSIMKFSHGENVTLSGFSLKNCYGGHFIEFVGIRNSIIENVKLYGTFKGGADQEAIQLDNANNGTQAPYCEPFDGTPCDNVTVKNCTIDVPKMGFGVGTCYYCQKLAKNITVEGCDIRVKTNAIKPHQSDHFKAINNTFHKADLLRSTTAYNFVEYGNTLLPN